MAHSSFLCGVTRGSFSELYGIAIGDGERFLGCYTGGTMRKIGGRERVFVDA